eukprot:snap_masked-scaffold_13-processed-gene-8.45-mRNA-1 protein AED:1.00 eAED:1.00 QI:0/-1/0/0/-1/1/1/0/276
MLFGNAKRSNPTSEEWGLYSKQGLWVTGGESNPLVSPATYVCHSGVDPNATFLPNQEEDHVKKLEDFKISDYYLGLTNGYKLKIDKFIQKGIYPSDMQPSSPTKDAVNSCFNQGYNIFAKEGASLPSASPKRKKKHINNYFRFNMPSASEPYKYSVPEPEPLKMSRHMEKKSNRRFDVVQKSIREAERCIEKLKKTLNGLKFVEGSFTYSPKIYFEPDAAELKGLFASPRLLTKNEEKACLSEYAEENIQRIQKHLLKLEDISLLKENKSWSFETS